MVYYATVDYTKEKLNTINELLQLCSNCSEFIQTHDELVGSIIPYNYRSKGYRIYRIRFDDGSYAECQTDMFGPYVGATLIWHKQINKDVEQEIFVEMFNELKTMCFTVNGDIYIIEVRIED